MSMTGIRRTSSSESYNVLVEAYHPIALGDIDRVEFSISSNGGSSSITTVTERAMWLPDDSEYDDPLPGDWGGGPAPLWCFGVKILMSDYAAGYIDVVPTVYAGSGESVTFDTVRIYNDKDGTDRRPSPKIVYWDYNSGSDSNSGLTTSLPVKSFEKAADVASTSNDCGGAIIYVNAAGEHQVRGTNFGQNVELYTGGHHWLQVMPKPGLTREEVKLVRIPEASDISTNWMYFKGTSTTPGAQRSRIRFSDLTVVNGGFKIGTWTHMYMQLWIDHCLNVPPSPFDEPVLGTGLHIRSIETVAGCVDLVNKKDGIDKIFVTGSTRRCTFGGGQWGDIVRGCWIDKFAGQVFQPQYRNSALVNILVTDIYQEVGVSGRFEAQGTFRIEARTGQVYRIQANAGYAGRDFVPDLAYLSGSSRLGIRLENFTNSSNNNMALQFLSGGYSGGLPFVDVSSASSANNLTPETDASAIVTNASFSSPTTNYNTWGPHSDIFQFIQTEAYPVQNILISNFAVFPCWESQGIFGSTSNLSGICFVNYYDGGIGEGPRSFYYAASSNICKNVLIRNSFISRLEVSSTDLIENSEIIDSVFGQLSASEGTMTSYTGQVDTRYNHFTGNSLIGGSPTSGVYFSSTTPALSTDATVSPSSTAYGTASTLWDRPTPWFEQNKGPWLNVSLADWSFTESTGTTTGNVIYTGASSTSTSVIPSDTLRIRKDVDIVYNSSIIPQATYKDTIRVSASTSNSVIPQANYNRVIAPAVLSSSSVIPGITYSYRSRISESISNSVSPSISKNIQYAFGQVTSSSILPASNIRIAPVILPSFSSSILPSISVYFSRVEFSALVTNSIIPASDYEIRIPQSILSNNSILPAISLTTKSSISGIDVNVLTISAAGENGNTTSVYVLFGLDQVHTQAIYGADVTISTVLPIIASLNSIGLRIYGSDVDVVFFNNPAPEVPDLDFSEGDKSYPPSQFYFSNTEQDEIEEDATVRIMNQLSSINQDLDQLPSLDKQFWSQNIIENISNKQLVKNVINLMTNNYKDLNKIKKDIASRTLKNK